MSESKEHSRLDKIKEYIKKLKDQNPTTEQRMQVYKDYQKEFQKSLFYFTENNAFIGNLLQEFNFRASEDISTACLAYDKKKQVFNVMINPWFFNFNLKTLDEKISVLHHEILHFTNKHLFRFETSSTSDREEHKRMNYATDLAINQYIAGLPGWCLHVRHFELEDGTPFPLFQTAEIYYDLLKDNPNAQDKAKDKCKGEMKEKGEDSGEMDNEPGSMDEHEWESLSEEEKKQMAEEMKSMIKRTIEKTNYGKSQIPDSIQDLLQEIDSFIQGLDYRHILMQAIKKHATSSDRMNSWYKPNKRYGNIAPGTINGKLPRLNFYSDTSGSMSVIELNQQFRVMDGFMAVGERKCMVGLWHTSLYNKVKYKKGQVFDKTLIQSGGTDIDGVIEDINKTQPDLAIILTDGEYFISKELKGQAIFIITENGNLKHPLADKVKTIPLKGLKRN